MSVWSDRLNRMSGRTRLVVCRLFLHLAGEDVAMLLGILNGAARQSVDAEGDLTVLGEGLGEICQSLLQYDTHWQAAANEGDVFWDEGEAGDYVEELFTDSAQRYRGGTELETATPDPTEPLSLPATRHLVVMLTIAYEGESPPLETDLADVQALKVALKTIINLHYQERLRAIQVHFAPAQLGDQLEADQILLNFPELIPL